MLEIQLIPILAEAIEKLTGKKPDVVHIDTTSNDQFGDFTTNISMKLSKELKKNPHKIAEELINNIPKNDLIEKTEIAGHGFVNFWLSNKIFRQTFQKMIKKVDQDSFGRLEIGKGKTAITDTSHPNIAKPMGVHHLLSTIIGQAINNLLETSGYAVIRDNYLGDWGTQYGKLIYAIRTWGNLEKIKKDPIPELLKLYVEFHEKAEKNAELNEKGREYFKKLENGDIELTKLWKWIKALSIEHCKKIWERLGVKFDYINGESFYEQMMQPIIEEGLKKKVIIEGNEGALIIPMEDENKPPAIIRKSDGATLYATRDLARIKYWQDELKGDLGINVVDIAQKLYFEQLFESAEKLGFTKMQQIHVDFGRMSFPEGSMSTRKGKVIPLHDLLDEAEKRAYEKIEEHNSPLPEVEKLELARIIGIGAIKYNILSQNRQKNFTFIWDQMLSFEGNSAPYLQYAYTRTQSILKKAVEQKIDTNVKKQIVRYECEEKQLIKQLLFFEKSIRKSLESYKPSTLCTYLFELSKSFSHFYNNLRVLDTAPEKFQTRIQLVKTSGYVLKKGLAILGIEVPERM